MVFRGIRRTKNKAALEFHLYKISALGQIRREWELKGRREQVLGVNFEMASHAARALSALRHLEELGEVLSPTEAGDLRSSLSHVLNLPAIAEGQLPTTSIEEINRTYSNYRQYNFPDDESIEDSHPNSGASSSPEPVGDESLAVEEFEEIASQFGVPEEMVSRKYMSYFMALRASGSTENWNEDIDDHARSIGALTEEQIDRARTDFNQAVLNRVIVALAMLSR